MADAPLVFRPATELASLIREGRVTAVQIVDAHLRQIRQWNPHLHAVVSDRQVDALREAEEADAARRNGQPTGPLHGVPLTLKDSLRVRGVRSTFGGLPPYSRHRPRTDCKVSERLRQAVAIKRALQPHKIEQLIDAGGNLFCGPAQQMRRDADIVGHAHVWKQPAALEDIADAPAQPDRISRANILALDRDGAAIGLDQPVRQPQQRGLAGT